MADEAELHVGLVVRLDVDLAEVAMDLVTTVTMHCVSAVDNRDHHVDLLLTEDAHLQEPHQLITRAGADATQVVLAECHGGVTHLGEA